MRTSMMFGFAIVLIAALIACDDDEDSPTGGGTPKGPAVVTAGWQGDWDITLLATPCDAPDTLLFEQDVASICEGDTLTAPFSPFDIVCEGTVTDTRIDVDCDDVMMEGPCRMEVDTDWTMMRTGDEFTGLARVEMTGTGGCNPDTVICVEFNFSGTRIGDGSASCTVAAQRLLPTHRDLAKGILPRKLDAR